MSYRVQRRRGPSKGWNVQSEFRKLLNAFAQAAILQLGAARSDVLAVEEVSDISSGAVMFASICSCASSSLSVAGGLRSKAPALTAANAAKVKATIRRKAPMVPAPTDGPSSLP